MDIKLEFRLSIAQKFKLFIRCKNVSLGGHVIDKLLGARCESATQRKYVIFSFIKRIPSLTLTFQK